MQLYGVDPATVGRAVEMLVDEGVAGTRPAHIDLNFGCPVPKVTRKGGGGALPWKRGLLAEILAHAVAAATPYDVPVTMKTRKGLDDDHLTYLDAGRIVPLDVTRFRFVSAPAFAGFTWAMLCVALTTQKSRSPHRTSRISSPSGKTTIVV
mgnify:CR=1 FL=1